MRPRHVYVHVPFCARRCSYCDFAIAVRRIVPVDEYLGALRAELRLRYGGSEPWEADTLYFGGGTPSRLGGEGVARAVALLREHVTLADGAELTIEANPEDVTADAVARWREAGVNRLSLGSQTFSDEALRWMHRAHDGAGVERAAEVARAGGIENFSLDLIFALPDGVPRSWQGDVERALSLAPQHVSLYGLTVEHGTPLARWRARGEADDAPDESYEEEFLHADARLTAAGFDHYEVSNYGLPGRHSRHNRSYWSGVPYAGLGPSAHEFDGQRRRWNAREYAEWVRLLADGRDPAGGSELLTDENRVAEAVYLGLRTVAGLQLHPDELREVGPWVDAGWGVLDGARLRLTPLGWLRLDSLAARLTLLRTH